MRLLTDAPFGISLRVFGSVNPSRVISSYPRKHYEGPRIRCSEKPHVSLMGAPTDGQYLSLCSPLLFCVIPLAGIPLVSLCIMSLAESRAGVINICFDRQKLRLCLNVINITFRLNDRVVQQSTLEVLLCV